MRCERTREGVLITVQGGEAEFLKLRIGKREKEEGKGYLIIAQRGEAEFLKLRRGKREEERGAALLTRKWREPRKTQTLKVKKKKMFTG